MYAFVATPTRASVGRVFRAAAERKVRAAGYPPERLPPGQYLTDIWPVLHAGEVPSVDLATWTLRVFGEVERVHWRELAPRCHPRPTARFAIAHAEQGFTANVPLAALEHADALLATHADGAPLTAEHGGPLRLVVPGAYFWKSAKWLRAIELSPVDRPGFWERYGYANDADPWQEHRYAF